MIEILAGKSAALHGVVHDASPFLYNESNDPVEYFGECLSKGCIIVGYIQSVEVTLDM